MLDFYAVFMAFYISSTLFEHLQHSRATGDGEDVSTAIGPFSDCFADALNVVEAIKQVAGYKYALLYVAVSVMRADESVSFVSGSWSSPPGHGACCSISSSRVDGEGFGKCLPRVSY